MADFNELGTQGLAIMGGYVVEEWNSNLRRINANKLYLEMRDNDPIIGAVLFVIEYLLSSQTWKITKGEGRRAREAERFVDECMKDMEHTWNDFISEALSCVQYGWAYHEIVYKIRDDGKIGWRKIPIRSQTTLQSWVTDERNNVVGMLQQDPYARTTTNVIIPRAKSLLFRTTPFKGNPEGRSVLRSAVRPYQYLKRLQEIEAIGVERELAGLPVLEVPPEYLDANASPDMKTQVAAWRKMLAQIRRDEREGLIIPSEVEPGSDGNKATGFKLRLLAAGGKRSMDTNVIISRYENRIATTMLAQFILLGSQSGSGSFALADKQASVFTIALQAILSRLADEVNHKLIPDLLALNGFDKREYPTLAPEELQDVSLNTIATFVNQLVGAQVLTPDDKLEAHLRKIADFPEHDEATARQPLVANPNATGENAPVSDAKGSSDPNAKDGGTGDKANVRTEPDPGKRKTPK